MARSRLRVAPLDHASGRGARTRQSSAPGQVVERRERRFVVADASSIVQELAAQGLVPTTYRVRTLYLRALAGGSLRLREYDCSDVWWLEHKISERDVVRKIRHRLGGLEPESVVPTADVTYVRVAYELDGVRVTIDDELRHGATDFGERVVELKGELPLLGLRLPEPDERFSKLRWATGRYEPLPRRRSPGD